MTVIMAKERLMIKSMTKARRMARSEAARKRRREIKETILVRTSNLYSKLRRKRRAK